MRRELPHFIYVRPLRYSGPQRVQPIFRFLNAARQRFDIEFPRFARVALSAKGSPCGQDGRVIGLGQSEQGRRAAQLGSALEDAGRADIALAQQHGGARHQASRFLTAARRLRSRRQRCRTVGRRHRCLVTSGKRGCRGLVGRRRRRRR